jgi:hypothetical protein
MTYWNNKGRHTPLYEELTTKLVPEEGRAPTPYGELLSAIGRVYYDWYNNGGCNFGLPRFQLALHTIRNWHEEIDTKAKRRKNWPGTRDMLDRPLKWSQSEGSPSSYRMDDEWEKQLEVLVDSIIMVVQDEYAANEPQLVDMQDETYRDLLKFTNVSQPRKDWHEPDEQDIEANVTGDHLDNAMGDDPDSSEYVVTLVNGSGDTLSVNLATLLAIATFRERA